MEYSPFNPNLKAILRVTDPFPAPTECPHCHGPVEITKNSAIYNGKEYGEYPWIYLCVNKHCWASVGMHKETNIPLGTLAHAPLRRLRMDAKNEFNPVWQQGGKMSRSEAYSWLAKEMGLPLSACHFGLFNEDQCRAVLEIMDVYWANPHSGSTPSWKEKLKNAVVNKLIDTTPKFRTFKNAKKLEKK